MWILNDNETREMWEYAKLIRNKLDTWLNPEQEKRFVELTKLRDIYQKRIDNILNELFK